MKIGILMKEFDELSNWELRIVDEILNDQEIELSLLIQDGRKSHEDSGSLKSRITRLFKSKNILGKLLLKAQVLIERKFFKEQFTVNKRDVIDQLKEIPVVKLRPERKGDSDYFSNEDGEKIKAHNLDIILKHEFKNIRGPLLNSAKYGIWSFHHADISTNRGGPVGFWETVLKQPYVGVTLQQLTPEFESGLIIDKAFFNRHWSYVRTKNLSLGGSISLLLKNVRQLKRGNYSPSTPTVYYNQLYKDPNFLHVLNYVAHFYTKLAVKLIEKAKTKLFGTRYSCWTLFIGKGEFMNSTLFNLSPVKLPNNEFWADPFILEYGGENYVFFENYDYKTKKGKISCGKIKNQALVDVIDVLDLPYHLPYPYVFEENGDIFLMPETSENNRLELYKCINFPDKWELYSTAFEGEKVVDAFFYDDANKQRWLFVNKRADTSGPPNSELFIYKVSSLALKNLEPHLKNPVLINSRKARNGGSIFKYKNEIYRPSQANIDGVYGRALNINKIEKLTIDEYIEKDVVTVYPNFHEGLVSMHHLHQTDDLFVIDAAYKKM